MSGNLGSLPAPEAGEQRRTVLVVEDEVLVRVVAAEQLRETNFTVMEAVNAEEALRILATDRSVDVVFSDVNMPGSMNGLDLASVIRRDYPRVKVLLTSALKLTGTEAQAGPIAFLAKPYTLSALSQRIQELLEDP